MNSHPQFEEDLELYELGVLDGDDKAEIETHLAGCSECGAKLGMARRRLALLALAAPPSEPSAEVRSRILESFREKGSERRDEITSVPARPRFRAPVWAWACAGVCLVLLVAAGWLARENARLSRRLAELEQIRQQLDASNLNLRTSAARAQAVLDVLTGPQTIQVELSPAKARPLPHGKAFYNSSKGLLFYTTSLESLPSGRTYELWLIPAEGNPVDAGVFNTDAHGNGQVILPSLPQGLTAKTFAVTIEPEGGVPAPTGPMVLVGPVS